MNKWVYILICIAVMAVVTYITRALPLVLCNKKIENKYVRTFLSYLPYGVLAAMVFPEIFVSTAGIISGTIGTVVAIILAYYKRGLVTVALGATVTAFIVELIITLVA